MHLAGTGDCYSRAHSAKYCKSAPSWRVRVSVNLIKRKLFKLSGRASLSQGGFGKFKRFTAVNTAAVATEAGIAVATEVQQKEVQELKSDNSCALPFP